mmetsp:Transcript_9255/g.11457  ORF Transcript_9255/g.11457 Transcript_9255/m.11457 type:complete len:90 (-) Transcript_9255:94-363(-)
MNILYRKRLMRTLYERLSVEESCLVAPCRFPAVMWDTLDKKTADNIELTKSFQDFTVWNREVKPSQRDPVHKWMQWPELAAAIHTNTSD